MKLLTLQFALTGGIVGGLCFVWVTAATLLHIPGFAPFAKMLEQGYGFYGYTITWIGLLCGAWWGFLEGFFWFGIFALIYNRFAR